jgi:hypothetical protein
MRGLDPRIHLLANKTLGKASLGEADGLPGQARQ